MADSKFNIFGRSYESVGKESADFCIKTKGKVKIKWGNKYIDLVKDGKINVEADFIFSVQDKDHIGTKEGIYVTDDGVVYLKVGDTIIPIYGDTQGSDYVAYVIQDGKTGEEKSNAQKNIGINFDTLADAQASGISNGMVFISGENAIYKIKDGVFEKVEFKVPNPFTEPIVIKIAGGQYSLLIDGYFSSSGSRLIIGGVENGLKLYAETDEKFIDSDGKLNICIDGKPVITVESNEVNVNTDLKINSEKALISDTVKSQYGTSEKGYLLEMKNNESWLYVDNLVVRKGLDTSIHIEFDDLLERMADGDLEEGVTYTIDDYQNEWDMMTQREEDEIEYGNDGATIIGIKFKNVHPLQVTATSSSTISKFARFKDNPEWSLMYDINYRDPLFDLTDDKETYTVTAMGRIIWLRDEFGNEADYDFKHLQFLVNGNLQFTFNSGNSLASGMFEDGSLSGNFRNNIIRCDYENLERRSVPEDGFTGYILGQQGNIIQIKKEVSNNTFGYITGSLTVNTEICQGNIFDVGEIKKLVLDGEMLSNTLKGDAIENLTVSKRMAYTDMVFDIINLNDFPGAERCTIKDGIENCTFADVLKTTTIHSHLSGLNLDAATYPYLYSEKVVDVYMNEGELRHICMPDTIFPGMIVMYDGRKPIPTGWALCDGNNGTLNLLDKFVKFSSIAGVEGGEDDGMIKTKHLPTDIIETNEDGEHTHTYLAPVNGWSDNANDRTVMEFSSSKQTDPAGKHKHQIQLNKFAQAKFESPYNTVIPIMYIGG